MDVVLEGVKEYARDYAKKMLLDIIEHVEPNKLVNAQITEYMYDINVVASLLRRGLTDYSSIPISLFKDKQNVLFLAEKYPAIIGYVLATLKLYTDDMDVMLVAVKHNHELIVNTSQRIKDSKELVLKLARESKYSIIPYLPQYAGSPEIILAPLNPSVVGISAQLKTATFMLSVFNKNQNELENVIHYIPVDELIKPLASRPNLIPSILNKLTSTNIEAIMQYNGLAIEYVPYDRRTNAIIGAAIKQNRIAAQFV